MIQDNSVDALLLEVRRSDDAKRAQRSVRDRGKRATTAEKTYPESYVKKLHDASAASRHNIREMERRLEEYQARELANLPLEEQIRAYQQREQETRAEVARVEGRVVRSVARRMAREAGLLDLDDLAGLDVDGLVADDDGNVEGLDERIQALREAKPHWFQSPSSDADKKGAKPIRRVATPARKEGDSGVDHMEASGPEFASTLKRYGVV